MFKTRSGFRRIRLFRYFQICLSGRSIAYNIQYLLPSRERSITYLTKMGSSENHRLKSFPGSLMGYVGFRRVPYGNMYKCICTYIYIYAIVMLKREKNALIDSSYSPNLCGKIPFSSWQVRNVCKPCKAGSSKMGPTKFGVLSKWRRFPRGLDHHKKCHLFFFWLAKNKFMTPPGIFHLNKQILESQGGWMIFWFIVFVVGKIRGKHGFYYTFKCICCTKIRVSHLTF